MSPLRGWDPVVANDVRQLIRKLSAKSSFIISSHNLYEIEDICSSVIILDKGRLVACNAIAELAKKENKLNLTLDRKADSALLEKIGNLSKNISIDQDSINQEKLIIDFWRANGR